MKYLLNLLLTIVCSTAAYSQSEVKIGNQIWMTKNLDVSTFRNGEAIPEAKNAKQWIKAGKNKKAAFCYYKYDSTNGKVYGKLYNWYAVNDPRGIAPKGYHVPSEAEWNSLTDFLGESAGKKMKSKVGWKSYEKGNDKKTCPDCADWTDSYKEQVPCHTCKNSRYIKTPILKLSGNGDNSSGFNALPGGICHNNGSFYIESEIVFECGFWSSTESGAYFAASRLLGSKYAEDIYGASNKYMGLSVRCLKD